MSRLTKLQAVNLALSASGLSPVNTIESPTNLDARLVLSLMEAVQREALAVGWGFNTEYDVSLEVDINTGKIPVASDILRCEVADEPWVKMRGSFLFDRRSNTYQFDTAVMAKVIRYLEWDSLPEEVKTYIYKLTSARYYANHVGSDRKLQLLAQEAAIAEAAVREMDNETENPSIFDSPDIQQVLPRGHEYVTGAPYNGYDILRNPHN